MVTTMGAPSSASSTVATGRTDTPVDSAMRAANGSRLSAVRLQTRTSWVPVAATMPLTCIVAWNPAPMTATGPPTAAPPRTRAASPVTPPVRRPLMRPPPMTAMRPDPSAAWSTIWNEAPLADAV